jgi:hypothetical protein
MLANMMGHRRPKYTATGLRTDKLIDHKTFLGVEVEVENNLKSITMDVADYWAIHEDGSLRNNGMEYVFNQPYRGRKVVDAIELLFDSPGSGKWQFNERTGIHVHLDVRDLTIDQLKKLVIAYYLVESSLFDFAGHNRDNSTFCTPWQQNPKILKDLHALFSSPTKNRFFSCLTYFSKYQGLNLQCLSRFGSVEFRQLKTTNDLEKIFTWINLIISLKLYAKSDKELDIIKYISEYNMSDFYNYIFGENLCKKLLPYVDENEFWDSLYSVQALAYAENNGLIDPNRESSEECLWTKTIQEGYDRRNKPKKASVYGPAREADAELLRELREVENFVLRPRR